MYNIGRARLLIRVANQISDGADRKSLLAWADEILVGAEGNEPISEKTNISFPIPIFRNYKGKRYDAFLIEGWRVQLNGKIHTSPSAAANFISGNQENGLRVWRYLDKASGEVCPISKLRHR